jgi:hypothetical protein
MFQKNILTPSSRKMSKSSLFSVSLASAGSTLRPSRWRQSCLPKSQIFSEPLGVSTKKSVLLGDHFESLRSNTESNGDVTVYATNS